MNRHPAPKAHNPASTFSRKERRSGKELANPTLGVRRPSPHRATGRPRSFAFSAPPVNSESIAGRNSRRPRLAAAVRRARAPAANHGNRDTGPRASLSPINKSLGALCGLCLLALVACAPQDASLTGGAGPAQLDGAPAEAIEPLPSFAAPSIRVYSPAGRRSPFTAPSSQAAPKAAADRGQAPDPHRRKQHLEGFALGSLALVGTLAQGRVRQGLVRDGDGRVHSVRLGDYLGADHGRISRIEQATIEVTELISTGDGSWTERRQTLEASPTQAAP